MKYIKQVSNDDVEELKELLNKCNLPKKLPSSKERELSLEEIGNFVYRHCENLMPERFINLLRTLDSLNNSNNYIEFKEGLIKDLLLNVKIKYLYDKTVNEKLYIESNYKFTKNTIENVNKLYGKEEFNVDSIKSYSKIIDNHIKNFFSLTESARPNKAKNKKEDKVIHADIPSIAVNLLIYTGITYTKFHEKWELFALNNYKKLKEHEDIFRKLVDEYSENKDIELWLFEKTYNIQLIKDIIRNTNDICEEDLNKVFKHLSLSYLLNNLNSRRKVIQLLTQNKRLIVRDEDELGNGCGNQYYSEKELNIWIDTVKDIILQMVIFSIPIMELYLYYLIYKDENTLKQLELYSCASLRNPDNSQAFNMDHFNFIWKRFNEIYKIYKDEKLSEAFYAIEFEIKKEEDKWINLINEISENKCIQMVNDFKEHFK